ncbi:hypothetical protein AB205_0035290 [Aquarana catesbeiana]|uniref:Uncharacterized protein n=1 Tax=Aquarana catesbeiana TaxID=8400 RepID=A0A2G9R3M9_AQUCT|nr:hypothetical protein AB205_0035290 [Aquarana catesbeiana]
MFHIPISGLKYLCAKYTFCFIIIGEKRLGIRGREDTTTSGCGGGEVEEVVEIVTTTGDVHVVEEQSPHFTSDSAQMLIQDIIFCSRDLDIIKQKKNEVEQKLKNMINVLGRN